MHRKKKKKKKVLTAAVELPKRSAILQNRFAMRAPARAPARAHSGCTRVKPRLPRSSSKKNRLHTNTFFFFFCLSGSLAHTLFARCSCPLLSVPMLKEMSVPSGVTRLFLIRGGQGVLCLQPCKGAVTGPPRLQLADGDKCSKAKHQLHSLELWDCESSGSPSGRGCSAFSQARTCHPSCFFSYFAEHLQPQTVHAYILR